MNTLTASGFARSILGSVSRARFASTTASIPVTKPKPNAVKVKVKHTAPKPEHGRRVFLFSHLLSKRVIMSLSATLDNTAALRQLSFLGKKTAPAALRKDHWLPLATIEFPSGAEAVGLTAFQKLREYRKLHDLTWDPEIIKIGTDTKKGGKDKDGRGAQKGILPKRLWKWNLCDQKADTVADMAAVLAMIGTETGRSVGLKDMPAGLEGERVLIKWNQLLDAEFAETWSDNVIHTTMVQNSAKIMTELA